jgi:Fungalysin metallopeptidase (M36)
MQINFIPNDPGAGPTAPAMRVQPKRPNRPAAKSGFTFSNVAPEGTFSPGTPQFLFWQCREAAIAGVEAWEASAGAHKKWQGNRKKLPLLQDAGTDLNAFYDRESFSFFHRVVADITFFSGASTDAVAHEVGHGLLDSVRPDFFDVNFLEVGALHEAFGDCMALLTALNDKESREKLLAVTTTLRKRNFVESTAENLSEGIRRLIPNHNAAEPRHAFNTFKFQLPQTLPSNGGPGALIDEVHSFGMIFTGCFWDLLANMFGAAASQTEATLLTAAQATGRILIAGVKSAIVTPRFLQSVGRAMVLADQSLNAGANRDRIRDAFQRHDILLGANAILAPTMALAGTAPTKRGGLAPATRKDLHRRLGLAKGAKLDVSSADLFGTPVVRAVHTREVPLGAVDNRLKGVVAMAPEPVIVGASGTRAALVGTLPLAVNTEEEVQAFVTTLLEHDRIEFDKTKKKSAVSLDSDGGGKTHAIKTVGGKKVLKRTRFLCAGHRLIDTLN